VIKFIDSDILKGAKNVFVKIRNEDAAFDEEISEVELYRKARRIEEESELFYRQKASEVESDEAREIFLKIAEEERTHKFLIENVIEFLQRPNTWLENAEFTHLDEY
jgi:rubrerythrin